MAFTPVSGTIAVLKFGSLVVPANNWKATIDGKLANTSNFRDGRGTWPTLPDVDFSTTMIWDAAAPPTDSDLMNLRPGTIFTAQCYTDTAKFFSFSLMVGTIEPAIGSMEEVLMLPITAKIQGFSTYPINLS